MPRNLERRIDVADFGTPVLTVDTFPQGPNARMVIEPKGLWEHSAYQADNRFILEVKPILEDPNKLVQGTRGGYKGEKLSLNFQNVEVRAVLQVIADFTGLNIITSDTVQGSLTLRLKDIPWDQALDIILQTKGLDMRKNGNVVLIAPREELALKEKQQLENAIQIGELEPLVSESFQLNYIKAQDILNLITSNRQQQFGAGAGQTPTTGGQGSIISKRGVAIIDPRSNILFVTDTASRLEEVRKIIRQIDTPIRQVLIEARIVIASDRFSQQLGVRFGQQTGFTFNNKKYSAGSGGSLSTQPVVHTEGDRIIRETRTQTPFELASGIATAGYSDSPQLNVNLPVPSAAGQLALTLINLGSGNLINLELSALEADARGKVVSSPRVVTGDNQKAAIEQGTEIPYVTPGTANSPATVQFKKAVLRLDVTPQITADGRIIMVVEVRKDTVGQYVQLGGGFSVPSIDTKNVVTQISVNNGDTAVIGGIYEEIDPQRRDAGALARQHPDPRLPLQADRQQQRKGRASDLPHAAHRQGHGNIRAVSDTTGGGQPAVLQPIAPVPLHRGNLFLVGLPGAGKSTLGRQLARRLHKRFVDADAELEQRLGVSIPTIFEIEGENGLPRSRGGGARGAHGARRHRAVDRRRRRAPRGQSHAPARTTAPCVYLHAEPTTLYGRIRHSRNRPLLQTADPLARLAELYAHARRALPRDRDLRRRVGARRGDASRPPVRVASGTPA